MRVYLDTIGCRLNQAEIEKYTARLAANGNELVSSMEEAELAIINTCAVTSEAGSDSRQKIRQAGRAGNAKIVATGCLATIDPDGVNRLPNVVMNIHNGDKDDLVQIIDRQLGMTITPSMTSHTSVLGTRKRTRSFIKAQDGCDNHCTFCITRLARGASRSVPVEEVIADIQAAREAGVKEAVLTGVQLGGWGRDLEPKANLGWLVRRILDRTDMPRIRLSSVEPWDLSDDFFEIWKNPRICRQLHLPAQSGSDSILKRMGRRNTRADYRGLVFKARAISPQIAITTDVLTGFPGETDRDFTKTVEFIKDIQFAGGHVFTFSPRPGTPAYQLIEQVPTGIKKERSRILHNLFDETKQRYGSSFLGSIGTVLWETGECRNGKWHLSGWTDNYMKCLMISEKNLENQIEDVILKDLTPEGFLVEEVK